MEAFKRLRIFRKTRAKIEDPKQSFNAVVLRLNRTAQVILGMDVLNPEFSFVNPRFTFLMAIMISFMYADIESAILADDIEGFTFNIAVFGFGLQGMAKLDAYLHRRPKLIGLFLVNDYFLGKCESNDRWKQKMADSITISDIVVRVYVAMYGVVFFCVTIFGMLMSLWHKERLFTFGFQFSFIDTSELAGYLFTYLYQITGALLVLISSYCNDCVIVILFVNAFGMFDCIISDLKELAKFSQLEKTSENRSKATKQMKAILQNHQEVIEYLNNANRVYRMYFCMSLVSMTGTISVLLIALVWLRWYPAIVLCCVASFQIFTMCFLGTLLLLKGEELEREIYDTTWYDLDVSVQHSLKLLLLASQNTKEISYRFGVMNMETYVQSHKFIYSLFTMLVTTKE